MFVGRITANSLLLSVIERLDSLNSQSTYACARKSRPRPVTDFDNQGIACQREGYGVSRKAGQRLSNFVVADWR